jgi:ribitol-5-phosphate 2-dehydrogenase (NADP+) / D-ribitol-5-phosphate cytidylyltransferase
VDKVQIMHTVAAVLAGGTGQRAGLGIPKQLLMLGGKTVIERSVGAFSAAAGVDEIIVVMAPGYAAEVTDLLKRGGHNKVSRVLEGGVTRSDSAQRAIASLGTGECNLLLHDAARPLVSQQIIDDCLAALRHHEAVGVTVASSDTVVVVEDGVIAQMPSRDRLHRCQTPQGFRLSVIRRAYQLAAADPRFAATDDCGVVLRYLPEVPIATVAGSERNIKITYPHDVAVAEALLDSGPASGKAAQRSAGPAGWRSAGRGDRL